MDEIKIAQVAAAENIIVRRLQEEGLLPPNPSPPEDLAALERVEKLERRQSLESSLATAFCAMQRSMDAGERQKQWLECLRLCAELEKLNEHD